MAAGREHSREVARATLRAAKSAAGGYRRLTESAVVFVAAAAEIRKKQMAGGGAGGGQWPFRLRAKMLQRQQGRAEILALKKSGGSPKAAFEKAWPQLDADYIAHANKQPKKRGLFSGSCACAMYLDCAKNRLFISNLGDSRAVLANVDETGWVETVEMSTDHSAGTFVERHRVKEEHSHDPNVVREEWDEFLEVYVYLVKCAPRRRLVFPSPSSCLRTASHDLGAGKRAGTSACSLAPSATRT